MASERIRLYLRFDGNKLTQVCEEDGLGGATHITLPLDANALDAGAVEAAYQRYIWTRAPETGREAMRAALAAYARYVAGGAR